MDTLRKHPLFAAILLASAVACVAQGWFIYTTRERAKRTAIQLEASDRNATGSRGRNRR